MPSLCIATQVAQHGVVLSLCIAIQVAVVHTRCRVQSVYCYPSNTVICTVVPRLCMPPDEKQSGERSWIS